MILATFAPPLERNGNNNIIMRKKKKHCLQCEKYIVLHEYNLVVGQKTNLQNSFFLTKRKSDENWFLLNTFILISYLVARTNSHDLLNNNANKTQIPAVQTFLNPTSLLPVFYFFKCKCFSRE